MTPRTKVRQARRHNLLLSVAGAALNICMAAAASAQTAPDTTGAIGNTILASDQHQSYASVRSLASDPGEQLQGPAQGSSLQVVDNTVQANARGNVAITAWEPETVAANPSMTTALSTGAAGTSGSGDLVIASRQNVEGARVVGVVGASGLRPGLGAALTDVSGSSVKVGANALEAAGIANDASADLSLALLSSRGAGIVNDQSVTNASRITAAQRADVQIAASQLSGSSLELGSNSTQAIAYGSNSASALAVDGAVASGADAYEVPSSIDIASREGETTAQFAILSNQRLNGSVRANNTGNALVQIGGSALGSSIGNTANQTNAGSYGNRVDNTLAIDAPAVSGRSSGIANISNLQSVAAASVSARAGEGARTVVQNDLAESTLTLSENSVAAVAAGNQSDGNRLTVNAASVLTSADGGGVVPGIPPMVGTAAVDPSGSMTVSAPFSVQNLQVNQGKITASQQQTMNSVAIGGAVSDSAVHLADNSVTVGATGSRATNGLAISGATIGTAADLNNLQIGQGSIAAAIGSATQRAGFLATAQGPIEDSTVTVTGNDLTASANQSSAANALSVEGAALVSTSGHSDADAGDLADGVGASADYALANLQQIVGGYQLPVKVSAQVHGAFGTTSGVATSDSTFVVSDNSQTASASGNSVSNDLSVKSASFGAPGRPAIGTALASAQSAQANIKATSDMVLATPSGLTGSSAEIADNSSIALARMNAASNAVTIDAALIGPLSNQPATVEHVAGSLPQASGDHVLANTQSATGSVASSSSVALGGSGPLDGATLALNGNSLQASAAANSATSTLSMVGAVAPAASVALVNSQSSTASVKSAALFDGGSTGEVSASQTGLTANSVVAQATGNGSTSAMTLTGANPADCAPDLAVVTTGPLNSGVGPAILSNAQMNAGAVSASAVLRNASLVTPTGDVSASAMEVTGNVAAASAFGNSAGNNITPASATAYPAVGIVNNQINTASVTATSAAVLSVAPTSLSGSRAAIAGNAVTAQAVGNYASSTIAFGR